MASLTEIVEHRGIEPTGNRGGENFLRAHNEKPILIRLAERFVSPPHPAPARVARSWSSLVEAAAPSVDSSAVALVPTTPSRRYEVLPISTKGDTMPTAANNAVSRRGTAGVVT
jgi:hypothetical protein